MKKLPKSLIKKIKDVIETTSDNLDSMKRLGTEYFEYDRYEFLKNFHSKNEESHPYIRDIETISVQLIQMELNGEIYMEGINQKESKNHKIIKEKK